MEPSAKNLGIISDFVKHCVTKLGIRGNVDVRLVTIQQGAPTAGSYDSQTDIISVSIKNRAVADCLRTIAHELTHMKQKEDGTIFPSDDEGLQKFEDEANTSSGRLVRFYGRKHREIYSDLMENVMRKLAENLSKNSKVFL